MFNSAPARTGGLLIENHSDQGGAYGSWLSLVKRCRRCPARNIVITALGGVQAQVCITAREEVDCSLTTCPRPMRMMMSNQIMCDDNWHGAGVDAVIPDDPTIAEYNWGRIRKAAKALAPKPDPANRFRIKETTPKGSEGLRTIAIEDIRTI